MGEASRLISIMRLRKAGCSAMAATSPASRVTMGAGSPGGAISPSQLTPVMSGMPSSVPPPRAKGTTRRTARWGNSCASAAGGAMNTASGAAAMPRINRARGAQSVPFHGHLLLGGALHAMKPGDAPARRG